MGGGVNRAPENWGAGGSGKDSIDKTINQLFSVTLLPKAPKNILRIEDGQNVFSSSIWQMMVFLNPFDAMIPKILFSFFAHFWVRVTSEARGSVLGGFWGVRQLSPFWGGRLAKGFIDPPLPIESPPAHFVDFSCCMYQIQVSMSPQILWLFGACIQFVAEPSF